MVRAATKKKEAGKEVGRWWKDISRLFCMLSTPNIADKSKQRVFWRLAEMK